MACRYLRQAVSSISWVGGNPEREGWSQRGRHARLVTLRRHTEQVGTAPHLPPRKHPGNVTTGARRHHAVHFSSGHFSHDIGGSGGHPAVVMHHVEPELVEGLVHELADKTQLRFTRNQQLLAGVKFLQVQG